MTEAQATAELTDRGYSQRTADGVMAFDPDGPVPINLVASLVRSYITRALRNPKASRVVHCIMHRVPCTASCIVC
jgi:hypothetical protein